MLSYHSISYFGQKQKVGLYKLAKPKNENKLTFRQDLLQINTNPLSLNSSVQGSNLFQGPGSLTVTADSAKKMKLNHRDKKKSVAN